MEELLQLEFYPRVTMIEKLRPELKLIKCLRNWKIGYPYTSQG